VLSVSGPTVTVDAKRTGSVLTGASVLDATHEGHILAMLASPSAVTGTIKFVGDVSPFDAPGGPAVWQGEALSSLFAAVSTLPLELSDAFARGPAFFASASRRSARSDRTRFPG